MFNGNGLQPNSDGLQPSSVEQQFIGAIGVLTPPPPPPPHMLIPTQPETTRHDPRMLWVVLSQF